MPAFEQFLTDIRVSGQIYEYNLPLRQVYALSGLYEVSGTSAALAATLPGLYAASGYHYLAGSGLTSNLESYHVGIGSGLYLQNDLVGYDIVAETARNAALYVPLSRTVTAGSGLIGGGSLTANLVIDVAIGSGLYLQDNLVGFDIVAETARLNLLYAISGNVPPNERTITAGSGLIGGGSLAANRVIDLAIGSGLYLQDDLVGFDIVAETARTAALYVPLARTITAGSGLIGGGSLTANRIIDIAIGSGLYLQDDLVGFDIAAELTRNNALYVPLARTITAGSGLIGGGTLSANLIIDLQIGSGLYLQDNLVGFDIAAGDVRYALSGANTVRGTGTSGTLPIWNSISGQTNSYVRQSGISVIVSGHVAPEIQVPFQNTTWNLGIGAEREWRKTYTRLLGTAYTDGFSIFTGDGFGNETNRFSIGASDGFGLVDISLNSVGAFVFGGANLNQCASITPVNDAVQSLGLSSLQWGYVYGASGIYSGAVSGLLNYGTSGIFQKLSVRGQDTDVRYALSGVANISGLGVSGYLALFNSSNRITNGQVQYIDLGSNIYGIGIVDPLTSFFHGIFNNPTVSHSTITFLPDYAGLIYLVGHSIPLAYGALPMASGDMIDNSSWRFTDVVAGGTDLSGITLQVGTIKVRSQDTDARYGRLAADNTWTGRNVYTQQTYHSGGLSLGPSGNIDSEVADVVSNLIFQLRDRLNRTSLQDIIQILGSGGIQYMRQYNTGEFTVGYSISGLQPQTGSILGFLSITSSHPSWAANVLSEGIMSYIKHDETSITPARITGGNSTALISSTSATVPTATMALYGHTAVAGSAADSSSYSGKKLAAYRGQFSNNGISYRGGGIDVCSNIEAVYGNWDLATELFCDFRGYFFIKGNNANPTNRPTTVSSARIPIQAMASGTQAGILGVSKVTPLSQATGHVDENINQCRDSFFMSVPFPSPQSSGSTTLRAVNTAHLAIQGYNAPAGGPTWQTWYNPEDDTKYGSAAGSSGYYGVYFEGGTNNPRGLHQHNGSVWEKLATNTDAIASQFLLMGA